MALFKCKMCGGALEITNNETVATCEYCGTQQTLPHLDDDRKANLYDRANHFRRNNEFDKAMGIYEQILTEDSTDAEAYWSLVLCRYGIEYVEDPSSRKRIPTVNRAQFTSVFDDDNYKSALQHADGYQRSIYEGEAKTINEIQKGILAISQKEEPFDVFICYKESDSSGRRTPDSVLANDLYHQLTQEGFNVFFARITLEDKLGSAYEPYIFAALNSAKVMVVLGTKPEYFKAVWVRNEWSRYLALIKQGQKKMLIPAYKDMDPYDLPDEFSHLQAQDMGKLGFMQDLIRGIKKITQTEEPQPTIVKETVIASGNANTAPLLKRAFMFLEDGDWTSADEYCEKVLDLDPEYAEAYLGKLMAQLHVKKQEELKDQAEPFDYNNSYQKALRFAPASLKESLSGYIDYINTRNENARIQGIYDCAKNIASRASNEYEYLDAAERFESIDQYQDSASLSEECYKKAEEARKDAIYWDAVNLKRSNIVNMQEKAMEKFQTISGWKDADQKIAECQQKIQELKAQEEASRLERERKAELARKEAERIAKRNKKIAIIITPIVCAVIAFIIVLNAVIIPDGQYNDAVALMDAGKYTEAITAFEALEGYRDSATKMTKCNTAILDSKYDDAIALMGAGKYAEAIAAFEILDRYRDSQTRIRECNAAILDNKYNNAIVLLAEGKIINAYENLVALEGYKDSAGKASSIYDKYKIEKLKVAEVGDYVVFGAYEQDNNTSNGKEDVEWLVLKAKDGKILVTSKYALDCKPYNPREYNQSWEVCGLRMWLNNDFINAAFSSDEMSVIPTVAVREDTSPTHVGKVTQDRVFLLSVAEANLYLRSNISKQCKPTDYAVANGAYVYRNNGNCCWWLRENRGMGFAYVQGEGYIAENDSALNYISVRPALWIDLSKFE